MEFSGMNIIEHPGFSSDEAWIIFKKDAPQVPHDLGGEISVPCVLTGDMAMDKRTLALLRAINVPGRATVASHAPSKGRTASSQSFNA